MPNDEKPKGLNLPDFLDIMKVQGANPIPPSQGNIEVVPKTEGELTLGQALKKLGLSLLVLAFSVTWKGIILWATYILLTLMIPNLPPLEIWHVIGLQFLVSLYIYQYQKG